MIKAARDALVSNLGTISGVQVLNGWPDRVIPPVVFVVPADPYVTAGQTFGEYKVNVNCVVVAAKAGSVQALGSLEDMVESVLNTTTTWAFGDVDQPAIVSIGGAEFLATIVHLSKLSTL